MLYNPLLLTLILRPSPFALLFGIIVGMQGIFLLSLAWVRPDIAHYKDIVLGILALFSSYLMADLRSGIHEATELVAFLLCSITAFSILETIRLR
jgi:hypothetical protein